MSRSCLRARYASRSRAMRHKYATQAIVLARTPLKESATLLTLLTEEFGVLRARAEGLRKPGAKLAHALQTLDQCDVTLVRGKEGWRLSGAHLEERWFGKLDRRGRERAGRVNGLLLRLVHGETNDTFLFSIFLRFLKALSGREEEAQDAAECFTALRMLASLGLDAGAIPENNEYAPLAPDERRELVTRINRGIAASGL